ncbi:hypothetical protein LTR62_005660 [Meristemomyces frigidus]|uniref:Uncharacterized protein n=1 Tax=Meristemomyces frigidus TaxID=1508187 RepID=A0AAN7TF42_9PEZI|nr:hypothetical protein LTR62_005660 [Meristemomyces frigidus]
MTNQEQHQKSQPDPAYKWGITPGKHPPPYTQPEENYALEEQVKRQKLRDKGVNPDSKAQMDAATKGSFWSKFSGILGVTK